MARDPYKYFRVEARELVDQLGQFTLELERAGSNGETVARLLRIAHTLKGAARVVRQPGIADHAHAIEDVLAPFRDARDAVPRQAIDDILRRIDSITGAVDALDAPPADTQPPQPVAASPQPASAPDAPIAAAAADGLGNLLVQLTEAFVQVSTFEETRILARQARRSAELLAAQPVGSHQAASRLAGLADLLADIEHRIASAAERADRELRQAREEAERLRLVPAAALFGSLGRTARDAAHALGKSVHFENIGGDIRLEASVIRLLRDALIQMVRNAVAHGIEDRQERLAAGKPAEGRVSVRVERRGRRVAFICQDDGKGIDVEALRSGAARRGQTVAEDDLAKLLLTGRTSTSATVTEVSGRGIGMDIVQQAVATLQGDFAVTNEPGKGTRLELIVPLSVASLDALVVEAGGMTVTLPVHAVRHAVRLDRRDIHSTPYGDAIIHEGHARPLVPLSRLLGGSAPLQRTGPVSAIIVGGAAGQAAIVVDSVVRTVGIVFRKLPELAAASGIVAGASFDADGTPLLMLDPDGLIDAANHDNEAGAPEIERRPLLVIDDSLTTRMLEQSILESAGYSVDLATSAEEGLDMARRGDYALALVDVEMPGMDGFTFIEHIRRDTKLRDLPAILVTSRNAPEDLRRGMEAGAQGYVVKSEFNQADLLARIKQLVT